MRSIIPYLDLLAKQVRETAALLPDAVAEFQRRPVMYFFDGRADDPVRRQALPAAFLPPVAQKATAIEAEPGDLNARFAR